MIKSPQAFRIDHVEAMTGALYVANTADTDRSKKLAYLMGARMALVSGGVPEDHLAALNMAIDYFERNIDMDTPVTKVTLSSLYGEFGAGDSNNGNEKANNSGS